MHPAGTPHQAPGLPQIGDTLGGKYEIVGLLGEGGMAFVFEANHNRLHQRVAIKLLTPEFARDTELVARFEREARAVARLRTRHVARVIDVDTTPEGIPYIVMEFLEGRDLDAELQARTSLPFGEAVDYLLQACAGMLEAHGLGIVHRDLKPANLFLANDRDRNERVLKVLDFGISKIVGEATRLTGAGAVMGTVLYMSPEQVRAQPSVDTRADIWSLGVILFELIAGRAPWEGSSHQIAAQIVSNDPPDLRTFANVPENVADTVRTMLQRDPARRFASVRDVIAALAPYAPMGSVGAGIAEQLAVGATASRRRPSGTAMMQQTVPMSGSLQAPPAQDSSRSGRIALPAGLNTTPAIGPSAPPPGAASERAPSRLALILAIAVGLLGAVGIVLIWLVVVRHTRSVPSVTDAGVHASPSTVPSASAVKARASP